MFNQPGLSLAPNIWCLWNERNNSHCATAQPVFSCCWCWRQGSCLEDFFFLTQIGSSEAFFSSNQFSVKGQSTVCRPKRVRRKRPPRGGRRTFFFFLQKLIFNLHLKSNSLTTFQDWVFLSSFLSGSLSMLTLILDGTLKFQTKQIMDTLPLCAHVTETV